MTMREVTDPGLLAQLEAGEMPEHPMAKYGEAVRYVESRGNPNAVSPAGAIGADQFMPETARAMGLKDPRDPVMSAVARDLLLAENYSRFKDPEKALAAYNAGPGAVASGRPLPKETQDYIPKVLKAAGRIIPSAQAAEGGMKEVTDPDLIARLEAGAGPKAGEKSRLRKAADAEFEAMPAWKQALVGAGKSVADVGRAFGVMEPADKDIDEAITDTGTGMAGNLAGEIALTAVPGTAAFKLATAPARIANATSKTGKLLKLATGGAAAGATGEAMMNRDPLTGAAIGAIGAPVIDKAVRTGGSVLRSGLNSFGASEGRVLENLHAIAGTEAPAAARALRGMQSTVPGEQLVVGDAASASLPWLKALQERASKSPDAGRLLEIEAANQKAREAVLEPIAARARAGTATRVGQATPDSPAQAQRGAQTQPLYETAGPQRVTINHELQSLLEGPEAQALVRRGEQAFDQEQMINIANRRPTAGSRIAPDPDTGALGSRTVAELQHIKNKMTEAINDARNSNDFAKARNLNETRRYLTQQIEQQVPDYREATSAYRILSGPQNRGQVAQALQDALRAPSGKERATAFLTARQNAPRTIKRSVGDTPYQQLEQVMLPGQMRKIEGLQQSLERKAAYDALEAPESILPKYQSIFDKLEDWAPPYFSQVVTTIRKVLKNFGNRTDAEVERLTNEAVRDPNRFAQLLETLPPGERNKLLNNLSGILNRNQEIMGGVIGGLTGQAGKE